MAKYWVRFDEIYPVADVCECNANYGKEVELDVALVAEFKDVLGRFMS